MLKLYDMPGNSNSRKIRAIARECDVTLDLVETNLQKGDGKKPEFLAINPNGKIPALTDGPFKLFESNAILCYIAAKYDSPLLPKDARARSEVDQWLFWQTAHLSQATGKIGWERIYKPMLNMGAPDAGRIAEGLAEIDRFVGVLDGVLGAHKYVCGTQMTVADYALCGTIGTAQQTRLSITAEVTKFAHVKRWLAEVEARPAWIHAEK
jgi:glutathione S-transferase